MSTKLKMAKFQNVFQITCRAFSSCEKIDLKAILAKRLAKHQKKVKEIRKKYGKKKVMDLNIGMIYGGMRGIIGLLCETSLLDPNEGIAFRDYSIPQLKKKLPKADGGEEPLPEGIFWLMLTDKIPTKAEVDWVSNQWASRAKVPDYIKCMLDNFPKTLHPMAQLSAACAALNKESKFAIKYRKGMKKQKYWEYFYEDAMDLIARLPVIAARIYRNCYKNRSKVPDVDPCLDFGQNFACMMGFEDPAMGDLIRLYLTLHSDHEGGNVSSHATHLVASALSDPYLSYAAGINGLAGPLHGLANQQVLMWLMEVRKKLGDNITDEQVKKLVEDTLASGQVVPGYGHAVLRKTDPRYICFREFALKHLPDDPLFKLVSSCFKVTPDILKATNKVKNPWPNVDAHSGCLLTHFGMKEMDFYTVMFAVSRAIGVMASNIINRGIGLPIERPKSITTKALIKMMKLDDGDKKKGSKCK